MFQFWIKKFQKGVTFLFKSKVSVYKYIDGNVDYNREIS